MSGYAAFPALRMAHQFCQARPDAVVLKAYGNTSSPTILFVLKRILSRPDPDAGRAI